MSKILLLVHRIPYPPNKGDKVRSYHLLQHLARRHEVLLGTFIDDPDDERHIDVVRGLCSDAYFARLRPRAARLRSVGQILRGGALTLGYYRDSGLARWARERIEQRTVDAAVVFSSSMAQYVQQPFKVPVLIDFVDVDSQKWTQYAEVHRWPLSWVYRREGRALLDYERRMAALARRSYFTTDKEAALFARLAPEVAGRIEAMGNGVDTAFFAPDAAHASPYPPHETPIVFTGAMDYWPNVDAVSWFAKEVLPALRQRQPTARFYVVGRSPAPEVRALAGEAVVVTGTVPDVRPYLQHSAVVVAPLRLARGVQNKILEAMAMARPVVVSKTCGDALDALPGSELILATEVSDYVREVDLLVSDRLRAAAIGHAGRLRVIDAYRWEARLSCIDRQFDRWRAPQSNQTAPITHCYEAPGLTAENAPD
ncbi:MAG: hypothetical protein LKCHEGNO_00073 [Burkholderiaceae bacterium]|nr:hypothetical protein [Burkholderiaceae bacterium]